MASTRTSQTAGEANADSGVPSGNVEPVVTVNGESPNTDAPTEDVGASTEDIPTMAELTGIRYAGSADKRSLTVDDLKSLGVEEPKEDLEWGPLNDKLVTKEHFNAATRDALLALPDFVAE